jgi:uncharacterized low-complexity protein
MRNSRINPFTAAIGGAFVASLASVSIADVNENPFGAQDLAQGYNLLADAKEGEGKFGEGKFGEGKCGEAKDDAEGKCGEGKCGEGKCGEAKG